MEKERWKIGLAGNPNSGKSTVFNQLTGGQAHVGNWPGVTVEKKEGRLHFQDCEVTVIDLPGIYALTPFALNERVARDFIVKGEAEKIVVVVDASNLERNLYLTIELLELGVDLILDLNMMDIVRNKGMTIDIKKLSQVFGVPVVETVASNGEGIEDLKKALVNGPKKKNVFKIDYGQEIEREIEYLEKIVSISGYPSRWAAIKLLEGDREVLEKAKLKGKDIEQQIFAIKKKFAERQSYDLETALVERRYAFLSGLIKESVTKKYDLKERLDMTDRIDEVLINRYLGIPIFLGMMWLLFQIVFTIGGPFSEAIKLLVGLLNKFISQGMGVLDWPKWLSSLICDGVISGLGSVLVFLPNILLLFLGMAVLEASGYMARAAFVVDRIMHALGLHGKSFIPMLLGFGCNVPGIMAARTIEAERDRILTILIIPLMSCTARLPIYTLFAGAFFKDYQGWVVFSLYLCGIIWAVIVARFFKTFLFAGEVSPLVMELPPYRMPSIKGVLINMWVRSRLFLRKAGTVIFAGAISIWLLASLPVGVDYASPESFIGQLGSFFAPLLEPAGFGFWQAAVALIFGIIAKELVVGTFGTLYGVQEDGLTNAIQGFFCPLSAYAFMVMSLVYIPCMAASAVIKKETNWKWTFLATAYTLILGWLLAVGIYQAGKTFL